MAGMPDLTDFQLDRARKVISLLPSGARALSLTGGEPTLHADALIGLLEHCQRVAPGSRCTC
jgi:organic radical activating enzyme